jgi:K+-sensing histidine kinase KdpD
VTLELAQFHLIHVRKECARNVCLRLVIFSLPGPRASGAYNGFKVLPLRMNRTGGSRFWPYASAVLIVWAFVLVLRLVPAIDNGAAAPVLLLAVLITARLWGTGPALVSSATATLAYSYFFLAKIGFGLDSPADWAAFITFTISAVIVGELAGRAERRHLEAQTGRREIERLYQELQAAFDRASEAEAARRNEQLKATLLDALTHNLRTPLTAIKASVTALLEAGELNEREGLSYEGRTELLQVIDEESDRLNRYIEGLSAADRHDKSPPFSRRAVPLNDIVRAALARSETVTRDHHMTVGIDSAIPPLSIDRAAAVEALYILLDNASKYAPAGTKISVRAALDGGQFARISVMDEGPGIPVELREQVFEKFFRIPGRNPLDTSRPHGIGLGLPIARRLIEAQGGQIWIESPPSGRGTAFFLTLPLTEEIALPDAPVAARAAS